MSASPFRKKLSEDEERQTLFQRLTRFSRREVADADEVLGVARAFLEWDAMPYMTRYKAYLEKKANEPMPIGNHFEMVAAAARGAAYREIMTYLKLQGVKARNALGE